MNKTLPRKKAHKKSALKGLTMTYSDSFPTGDHQQRSMTPGIGDASKSKLINSAFRIKERILLTSGLL